MNATVFATVLPGLLVAHQVADYYVLTDRQARRKGLPGWPGRRACAAHVATYTATTALVVAGLWWAFSLPISPWWFAAGQLVSAVTHYWADRRTTLRWLCELLGKGNFYRLGAPREVTAYTEPFSIGENDYELHVYPTAGPDDPPGWDNPSLGTGAHALDQAWHWGWLLAAALLTSVGA